MKKSIFSKTKYNPDIRWIDFEGKECLYFYFNGIFNEKDAKISIDRTIDLILSRPKKKNIVVCNFLDVKNYETNARTMLQDAIGEYKDYLGEIYVITKSPVIFAAVEIVSFFTSMSIKVVSSTEKLQEKLQYSA